MELISPRIVFTLLLICYRLLTFSQDLYLQAPAPGKIGFPSTIIPGDFNNDGWNDLAVYSSKYQNVNHPSKGAVLVYYSNKGTFMQKPNVVLTPELQFIRGGLRSFSKGDFNNDGFLDIVFSTNVYGEPQLDRGFVQVFWGTSQGLDPQEYTLRKGYSAYGSFGSKISCLDYNNDDIDDLLVEARFDNYLEGCIYIYIGGQNFNMDAPQVRLKVDNTESLYFCFADDVNGDGAIDIICRSNSNWNISSVQIYIFYGGEGSKNMFDRKIDLENFIPLFYLDGPSIIMGNTFNSKKESYITGVPVHENTHEKMVWFSKGVPMKLNKSNILAYRGENPQQLAVYNISGNSCLEVKALDFFVERKNPSLPTLFQSYGGANSTLLFSDFKNNTGMVLIYSLSNE